jgi:16S rRNA (uracil1498-N3)-methyltransferase
VRSGWAADAPAAAHVFVDELGDELTIEGDDGHHLGRSLRLRLGETVTAADGHGHWRPYTVTTRERGRVGLLGSGEAMLEPCMTPALDVAFAITKGSKPEVVVQKLTELGVDRVTVVTAARSIPQWDAAREQTALARLRRVALEAAVQCRRSRLPSVDGPHRPDHLATHPGLVVADPAGGSSDLLERPKSGWLLLVGPEGGFSREELEALPGPRLRLGPHVLRAETAAIAGAAVLTAQRVPDA